MRWPVRRLHALGQDAAQLPAADLDVVRPADAERGPSKPSSQRASITATAVASASFGSDSAARPCAAGSIARVKVRLPASDHHECMPRPRPRVCRLAQTQSGSSTGPLDGRSCAARVAGRRRPRRGSPSTGRRATARRLLASRSSRLDHSPLSLSKQLARLDLLPDLGEQLGDAARPLGVDGRLHLHGLDREQLLPLAHGVARRRPPRRRPGRAGARRPGWGRRGRPWGSRGPTRRASGRATSTSRGWPLSSKKTVRLPSACGSPTASSLTISVLPGSISTGFSRRRVGPEEEDRGRQDRRVGVGPLVGGEVGEDAGIEHVARAPRGRWPAGPAASRPSRAPRRGRRAAGSRPADRSAAGGP